MGIEVLDFQDMTFDDFMRLATPTSRRGIKPKPGEVYRCDSCQKAYIVEETGKDISLYCLTTSRRSSTKLTLDEEQNDSHELIRIKGDALSERESRALKAYRSRQKSK